MGLHSSLTGVCNGWRAEPWASTQELPSRLSFANTSRIEQALIAKAPMAKASDGGSMSDAGLVSLSGATEWLNSPP